MDNVMLGRRIEERRLELGKTLDYVASEIGVAKSTISRYEKGSIEKVKLPVIEAIARVLGVNPSWIIGKSEEKFLRNEFSLPSNVIPMPKPGQVPLIGQIACGTPITAEQAIEDYVDLPAHIRADFALTCKGDSMIGAGVHDGDMVYIRQQPEVSNGQIAAVIVDEGEATLKRFYHDGSTVSLVAENPTIAPLVFSGEDVSRLRVIGLAVAFTHPLVQ